MSSWRESAGTLPRSPMTQFSPFPLHVQSFLYSGKTVTLVNQRGADVNMNSDVYRKVMETTEDRMKERHFRYATKGSFAQPLLPPSKPHLRKRTRKPNSQPTNLPTMAASAAKVPIPVEKDESESESDSESPEPVVGNPLQPSQRLLDFLKSDTHSKSKSMHALPKVQRTTVRPFLDPVERERKPPLRHLFRTIKRNNQYHPQLTSKEIQHSRRSLLPDSLLSFASL